MTPPGRPLGLGVQSDDSDNELNLATKVTESTDALATVRAALEQYRDIERVHSRPMNTQEQLGAGIVHYD